jgi:lipid-binding SYLF domain-containing protein
MKKSIVAVAAAAFALAVSVPAFAQDKIDKELNDATQIIQEMTGPQSTAGIPDDVLRDAKCIAVVPRLFQGGFIVGGRHGDGIATCRTGDGHWSPPAPFSITGGSFGLQIGGQEIGYVMLAMNHDGMQALMSGHFKVGAGVDAAAGPVGREASASTGWKAAALLSYSRAKGAYAGATLQGAELNQDHGATKSLYGQEASFDNILNGQVQMPDQGAARHFVSTVNRAVQGAS